ncbi:hypothetical protein RJ640_018313 [Escallonia rubra]|uniref:Bet v I/Major latex protein domain-containing protein n=1 Tax=Escallonia rubra TaxID=112253 RepID=A0AA88UMS8_9ASTE|nr:hypothetical protein RJ640_018313 [Escallonia rubra]
MPLFLVAGPHPETFMVLGPHPGTPDLFLVCRPRSGTPTLFLDLVSPFMVPSLAHLDPQPTRSPRVSRTSMFLEFYLGKHGKAKVAKEVIDGIDEKNKTMILRVIEGDLLELYKSFVVTLHVDPKGENTLVK